MTGWIGVDLDGTLAEYHGFNHGLIGKPIPLMVSRVKNWIEDGKEVRIVTARVCSKLDSEEIHIARMAIELWCIAYIGRSLEVTAEKDFDMIELWDDRARRVCFNTGEEE